MNKLQYDSDPKNTPKFDLDKFNCTDYAIGFAREAGIALYDQEGSFGLNGRFGSGSNPNMLGNALEEYMILQQRAEEDLIRELKKLIGSK